MDEDKSIKLSELNSNDSLQYSTPPRASIDGVSQYPIYTDILTSLWIVIRYLWLIIPVAGIGTGIVYYVIDQQPRIYESRASVVIYPQVNPGEEDDLLRVVDTMRYNVVGTYVQLLRSQTINDEAVDDVVAVYGEDLLEDHVIEVRAIDDSSVVMVETRAHSPEVARDLADTVIEKTMRNNVALGPLNEFYPLQILDSASLSLDPVAPDTTLGLVIGGIASVCLGIAIAFAVDSFRNARRDSNDFEE